MNQKYAKIVKVLQDYDAAPLGSDARVQTGEQIEKLGSQMSERDILHARSIYVSM